MDCAQSVLTISTMLTLAVSVTCWALWVGKMSSFMFQAWLGCVHHWWSIDVCYSLIMMNDLQVLSNELMFY